MEKTSSTTRKSNHHNPGEVMTEINMNTTKV